MKVTMKMAEENIYYLTPAHMHEHVYNSSKLVREGIRI